MDISHNNTHSQLSLFFEEKKQQARSRMPRAPRGVGYMMGNEHFQTIAAIQSKAKNILYSYPLGSRVSDEDAVFLRSLVEAHPEAGNKIGCGIASFEVDQNPAWYEGTRVFMLTRTDGTRDHFSYRKCMNPPTQRGLFTMICRRLIAPQLNAQKTAYFGMQEVAPCEYTGEMTAWDDAHCDHIPPDTFAAIIARFIEEYHIDINKVEITNGDAGGYTKVFTSADLAERWMRFHKENARLRVVSSYANMYLIPRGLPPDYDKTQEKEIGRFRKSS